MNFYRRNLPHWQPRGAEFFITFRLAGSLPKKVVKQLIQMCRNLRFQAKKKDLFPEESSKHEVLIQQKIFQKYEKHLDKDEKGPRWLANTSVAEIVKGAFHYRDQKQYNL